jgi:hypothetical protein
MIAATLKAAVAAIRVPQEAGSTPAVAVFVQVPYL